MAKGATVGQPFGASNRGSEKNSQIFMVTHNPNLAVVCDAEQCLTSAPVGQI